MKRNKLFLLLLCSLIILFGSLFISNVQGTSTLEFTFENEVLFDSSSISYDSTFNYKNVSQSTKTYNGTYSFTDDINGEFPDDWIALPDTIITKAFVSSEFKEHDKVLTLNSDGDIGLKLNVSIVFDTYEVEFWVLKNRGTAAVCIDFYDDTETDFILILLLDKNNDGLIRKYNGSGVYETITNNYNSDTWIHVKIKFDDLTHLLDVYVNGILEMEDEPYTNNVKLGTIKVRFGWSISALSTCYFDAFGFSWHKTGYTGTNFDVGTQTVIPNSITWDGTHFWILDYTTYEVYQYNSTGDYTGTHFDVETQDISPRGITWDGTYFWIIGTATDEVYQYNSNGDYTGEHFDVGTQDTWPRGIIWNGTYFLVIGDENNEVYQYTYEGVYNGKHFDVGTQDISPRGITWDGTYFWIVGSITDEVYQYNSIGDYTGTHFDVGTQDTSPMGITWDGTHFWVVGSITDKVYQYQYVQFPPYNINDNVIPYSYYTDNIEIKADEFAFNNLGEAETIRILNDKELINGWEVGSTQNDVSVVKSSESFDKEIKLYSDTVHLRSLKKSLSLTTNGVFNLTMVMTYLRMGNTDSKLYFGIFKTSAIEFSLIRLYYTGADIYLQSMDRDRGSYTNLCILDDSPYLIREFNFLTTQDNIVKFTYKDSSGINNVYTFSKIDDATNYYELVIVGSAMNDVVGTQEFNIDSISISVNGSTLDYVEDYGVYLTNLIDINWNAKEHNLINLNANGIFGFGAGDDISFESLRGFYNYTGLDFINCYDNTFNLNNFYFSFITDQSFNVSSIIIEGVKLNEGGYSYPLIYTYASVNPDNNYFRVDSYNRLQFTLTITDNNLEYIQAIFNVNDVSSENRTISFSSDINGDSKGFLSMDYSDSTISLFEFPYYATSTRVILPQTKTIKSFTILITDNNLDDNDRCSGYISNIKLIYNPDIRITIITDTLLGIIVPLIVMILPSVVMKKRFGITGVIVTFILMSLICVVSNLIPVWLFFIIVFSTITFLLMKEKIEVKI